MWQDQHPRSTRSDGGAGPDPAEVSGHHDVVVVGAGLTGLVTALMLARQGRSVIVLEGLRIGAGTTGRSTAKISALQGTHLGLVASRHARSVVQDYVDAQRVGLGWLAEFCDAAGVPAPRRDAITYATDAGGERSAREELAVARACGLDVAWRDELPLPFPTRGGVALADQLEVDPVLLLDALADEARGLGVRIVEECRVTGVRGRGPVRVRTERGEVTAGHVVVATNMPILDRGGFFARMKPARSYSIAFRTPVQAVDAMYLSADQPSRSLRDAVGEDGAPLLLVGGAGHTTGRSQPTSGHLAELRGWTARHWPDAVETHAWSAQDFVPHHALPYAGPVLPGVDAVLFAGGYSKWGMTNAAAAATVLTAMVTGGHVAWDPAFRTWSSHELRGLPTMARDNGQVGLSLTLGWAGAVARRSVREHGVARVCTHLGAIVTWNDAERSWDCPLHGSRFDEDGSVLDGPAVCGLRAAPTTPTTPEQESA